MFPFTDEDLQEPVNNIIEKKISPMLARDGGAIELLDIKNAKVYIQLKGACVGCSASGSTLKYVVEKELKSAIHPDLKIINVGDYEIEKFIDLKESKPFTFRLGEDKKEIIPGFSQSPTDECPREIRIEQLSFPAK